MHHRPGRVLGALLHLVRVRVGVIGLGPGLGPGLGLGLGSGEGSVERGRVPEERCSTCSMRQLPSAGGAPGHVTVRGLPSTYVLVSVCSTASPPRGSKSPAFVVSSKW